MILETIPVGPFQCNCVILGREEGGEALVIDPGDELPRILEIVDHYKLRIAGILHTHGHLDHIGAAGRLKAATGAPIQIHAGDLPLWRGFRQQAALFGLEGEELPEPDRFLKEGDRIPFGPEALEVMETPGHTPGSLCFGLGGTLFTGDTLFWKGIGRTDLWGGDTRRILLSIRDRLFTLPPETVVHPGHGPVTSVGDERKGNPFRDAIRSGGG